MLIYAEYGVHRKRWRVGDSVLGSGGGLGRELVGQAVRVGSGQCGAAQRRFKVVESITAVARRTSLRAC